MISTMTVDGAVSNNQNGICPTALHQNLQVPWIDDLDPNLETFYAREDIGRLHDFSFVRSPNLKVCVLQIKTH